MLGNAGGYAAEVACQSPAVAFNGLAMPLLSELLAHLHKVVRIMAIALVFILAGGDMCMS
jgi:hypothetical protein